MLDPQGIVLANIGYWILWGLYGEEDSKAREYAENDKAENTMKLGVAYLKPELTMEGDEEDEVIIFNPIVAEKRPDVGSL
ncbi:unnamed protein product [Prunus armeniaca]|uniref:Uncharacterized protein n=1 Tax=Prunus armeniaca TaxID=36596 RepID=A0A6J5VC20_PRUAR|nr:unnamed protein product [Prunus armeniaca]